MDEKEWLECTDPTPMLEFVRGKASDRKLRLFAVACSRRIWHLLVDKRGHKAVEVAERFADGAATKDECWTAGERAWEMEFGPERDIAGWTLLGQDAQTGLDTHTCGLIAWAAASIAFDVNPWDSSAPVVGPPVWRAARGAQVALLRDIFGNPFRPITLDPSKLSPTVTALAHAIYAERNFEAMPVLGDALEESGCNNEDILRHCRGPGEHTRGCWALDLVLGKE
jgi:hypothetical protein